jgi:hypothetical protein
MRYFELKWLPMVPKTRRRGSFRRHPLGPISIWPLHRMPGEAACFLRSRLLTNIDRRLRASGRRFSPLQRNHGRIHRNFSPPVIQHAAPAVANERHVWQEFLRLTTLQRTVLPLRCAALCNSQYGKDADCLLVRQGGCRRTEGFSVRSHACLSGQKTPACVVRVSAWIGLEQHLRREAFGWFVTSG